MKVLFFGNRRFVLQKLLEKNCDIEIGVIKHTHLEKDDIIKGKKYKIYESSEQVHERIKQDDFDILISNGLPYKLKIADLPKKQYVNIHPSFLPDLKGVDPVLGSILFERDAGATCHLMDSFLDTGPIISQIKIPFSHDLKASLLYQLSFLAEQIVFEKAWKNKFKIKKKQDSSNKYLYFTRNERTKYFDSHTPNKKILQIVKAFDNKNQGARFFLDNQEIKCHDAWISYNRFLKKYFKENENNSVVLQYEDTIVLKKDNQFLFLSKIIEPINNFFGKKIA